MIWILAILSGFLYRLGGSSKKGNWLDPIRNTKARDVGCALCVIAALIGLKAPVWAYIVSFGATFGSLTTYFEYWGSDDVEWYEWAITGFMYGVALFPFCFAGCLKAVVMRAVLLSIFTCAWSTFIKKDTIEEFGRGFMLTLSIGLLYF